MRARDQERSIRELMYEERGSECENIRQVERELSRVDGVRSRVVEEDGRREI